MNRILIADDNSARLTILDREVQSMGLETIKVSSPDELLEFSHELAPDVILVNHTVAEINNFQTLEHLKRHHVLAKSSVVILVDSENEARTMKSLKFGVMHYMLKPYTLPALQRKIEDALRFKDKLSLGETMRKLKYITISFDDSSVLVEFRGFLKSDVLREAEALFCDTFMDLTKKRYLVLDIRDLTELPEDELSVFQDVVELLGHERVCLILGKYLGKVLMHCELSEGIHYFGSFGEFRLHAKLHKLR